MYIHACIHTYICIGYIYRYTKIEGVCIYVYGCVCVCVCLSSLLANVLVWKVSGISTLTRQVSDVGFPS